MNVRSNASRASAAPKDAPFAGLGRLHPLVPYGGLREAVSVVASAPTRVNPSFSEPIRELADAFDDRVP